MLLQLAIGDGYGAGFEYVDAAIVRSDNDLSTYRQHPKHKIKPGFYTDDTQRAIANALALLSGEALTKELFARLYVECFKRDQRLGYAGRYYDLLCEVKDGSELLGRLIPYSDKSGAAMGASVFGILPTVERVREAATIQAQVTHDTTDGINAAVASALAAHYFLYERGPKSELGNWLESHVAGEWSAPWTGKVGEKGWMAVRAAVTAIMTSSRMSELLKACVAFTGDVDTVAAIALGAASHSKEIEQDLPSLLFETLENGSFGKDYLISLDEKLMAKKRELEAKSA